MTRLTSTVAAILSTFLLVAGALAQQDRRAVVVEYIAGVNIYIDAGTDDGIAAGDTLFAYGDEDVGLLGALVVISSSAGRSVVTFADRPFPVTLGDVLQVALGSAAHREAAAQPAPGGAASLPRQPGFTASRSLEASGRLALDLSVMESTTQPGNEVAPVDRLFTTPSLRFRTAVSNLPGGLSFNTNLRASTRYSTGDVVQPRQSLRIYQASLAKAFESVPLQFQLGRFYNPFETFSGYWDGFLVHVGERNSGLGGGLVLGFQPDRENESLSTDMPKYSAFLDYQYRGGAVTYRADVSASAIRPRTDLRDHTFFGLAQQLRWNRFALGQRLQIDRNPDSDKWEISQLDVRGSVPLGRRLSILTQYSLRQPFSLVASKGAFSIKRERATVGFDYSLPLGSFGADVTANRLDGPDVSYTYSSRFNLPRTPILDLGFSGSASYWKRDIIKTFYVSPGIRRSFGRLDSRLTYQLYSTENAASTVVTHTFDLALTFPLTRHWFTILQARTQHGTNLSSNSIYSGLWVGF
ncbi:MAG: hypothetical protein JSU87_16495 [Gemmatimonadota bacterium]|nr:MAG: hypothetical protein JSU87_16495 [Gemmatimonadota bacterium]